MWLTDETRLLNSTEYSSLWCERLTDTQRHNRNCIYVKTINGFDVYVLGEKYYCCKETD